ncbi:hypothetical protein H0H92_008427 [Tricholoma furcatifolium]|nr:hypothetical protein H0H92_008427 [Tricholoma furcatifolium]
MSSLSIEEEPKAAENLPTLDSTYIASRTELRNENAVKSRVKAWKKKLTTREGWFGDYDYVWLCRPSLPFLSKPRPPPFYALDADLPLVLAITSGLQHALSMLAGIITPPIIFASALNLDAATSTYMVSASLIGCGILSLVQISRIHLFGNYYLGTGLISVVGTSFNTLSTATAIFDAMYKDGTCPTFTDAAGVVTQGACPDAYGKLLGTAILMVGSSLIGSSGILNWGGGSNGCIDGTPGTYNELCPTIYAPRPLPWGSPEFIGIGFLSFISIIITEIFGSPFMKNISVVIGLIVGCIVSGATGYIDGSNIGTSPAITFLWVHRFKLGVYPPGILPMLAVYASTTMECIGDTTASAEASRVEVEGPDFERRIQGGVLVRPSPSSIALGAKIAYIKSDGFGGFVSALFTVAPLSVFAQNNGVIAITRCANRGAGRWCCFFLILFGVLGKISGVFLSIPNPVLGGVTTFLFGSVAVSGIRVLSYINFTRRERFILAAALSFGFGDLLVPTIFTHLFDKVQNPSEALEGFLTSITIILSTPFLAAGIVAVVLNLILPVDMPDREPTGKKEIVLEEAQTFEK